MIGIALTLPGLGETPPSVGGGVKKLFDSGTFAESFEGLALPRAIGVTQGKQSQLLTQPQPPVEEKTSATEPKQQVTQAAASKADLASSSVMPRPEAAPSRPVTEAATPVAQNKPAGLLTQASPSLHELPTAALAPEVKAAPKELHIPQQAGLASSGLTTLASPKPEALTPEPLPVSLSEAATRPRPISIKTEAKQTKTKPVGKPVVQATASRPVPPSHVLTTALAPATELTGPSAAPTISAVSAPAPALASPATPTQTPHAPEAKVSLIQGPASLPTPVSQPMKTAEQNEPEQTTPALPDLGASITRPSKPTPPSQAQPRIEAKTILDDQAVPRPRPHAQPPEPAASKPLKADAIALPEGSVSSVNPPKPTPTPEPHPAAAAKAIRDGHAVTLPELNPQLVEAPASNAPAQAAAVRPETGVSANDSSRPIETVPAPAAQPATEASLAVARAPSPAEKKIPAATVKHAAFAPLAESASDAHSVSAEGPAPSATHARNPLPAEHAFVADKSLTASQTPPAPAPDLAPLAIKPQEPSRAEVIPPTVKPSPALLASSERALSDPAMAQTTLQATPTVLEVGLPSGTHGWLKIRAEMGEGGAVQASIAAGTRDGRELLHRELPAIKAFLDTEQLPVTLQIAHAAAAPAVINETARTFTEVPSLMSFAPSSFQDAAGLVDGDRQHPGAQDHPPRQSAGHPAQSVERESFGSDRDNSPASAMPGATSFLRGTGGWLNVMA